MNARQLLSPRRIGVCGSSHDLSPTAITFCEAIGVRLAREPQKLVLVSGGTLRAKEPRDEHDRAAEWHIVHAAEQELRTSGRGDQLEERIETVVASGVGDRPGFLVGTARRPRGKTPEARRFSFVRGVDALFAIGGGGGTKQELALAFELGIPVLPVPLFGGSARDLWVAYRTELLNTLHIDESTASQWEAEAPRSSAQLRCLADEMVGALLDSLQRRCFVIMPFAQDFAALYDFVIEPAIRAVGDTPLRLDRAALPGDVGEQIRLGIASSDYVIAVLEAFRPNVLYELGIAHGCGKPSVLLYRSGGIDSTPSIPFDLTMQQRIEYAAVDANLVGLLEAALLRLPTRAGAARSR